METIAFIGVGKIGLPMSRHLIKAGHKVIGYRRGSLAELEQAGRTAAQTPAAAVSNADGVFLCLPSDEALTEVINGPNGIAKAVKPGQIVVEFGSHAVPFKKSFVAPLAEKGAIFIDGEVGGTPGMVENKKGVIYL